MRGIKTATALEREKTAGMDKKGETFQEIDDSAVVKGRNWEKGYYACAFRASFVDVIGSRDGFRCCPTDSHS